MNELTINLPSEHYKLLAEACKAKAEHDDRYIILAELFETKWKLHQAITSMKPDSLAEYQQAIS